VNARGYKRKTFFLAYVESRRRVVVAARVHVSLGWSSTAAEDPLLSVVAATFKGVGED
jgi:hypothetical protein